MLALADTAFEALIAPLRPGPERGEEEEEDPARARYRLPAWAIWFLLRESVARQAFISAIDEIPAHLPAGISQA